MIWLYSASVVTSFLGVFSKGFQHKNVIGGHVKAAFITSYIMAALDVITIGLIVKGGWLVALTTGTGAAFGIVAAMKTHDRLFATPSVNHSSQIEPSDN